MIFRVMDKGAVERLFDVLSVNRLFGPISNGTDRKGRAMYAFREVDDFGSLCLGYTTTDQSPKHLYLPYSETLCTFSMEGKQWEKHTDFNISEPFVIFGLHACDINAMNKLDKVLMGHMYPMPYYVAKRTNMFIVGIGCDPQPYCFCRSMGTDTVQHGFDLFLTDIGDRYFVEILSATAFNMLNSIKTDEPKGKDHVRYREVVALRNRRYKSKVDTADLTKILDMEFQSDVWEKWGEKCLSCGTCASVCPTCYCFGVEETVDIDMKGARKTRHLHSCNLIDFAKVAGGHNFRPESHQRLKYRYYHKHRGFVEAFEESLCVGCGRCGKACLADITVPEVISDVRGKEG